MSTGSQSRLSLNAVQKDTHHHRRRNGFGQGRVEEMFKATTIYQSWDSVLGWCRRYRYSVLSYRSIFSIQPMHPRETKILLFIRALGHGDHLGDYAPSKDSSKSQARAWTCTVKDLMEPKWGPTNSFKHRMSPAVDSHTYAMAYPEPGVLISCPANGRSGLHFTSAEAHETDVCIHSLSFFQFSMFWDYLHGNDYFNRYLN